MATGPAAEVTSNVEEAQVPQRLWRGPEEPFERISAVASSFGGFFIEDGNVVAFVTDLGQSSAAASEIARFLQEERVTAREGQPLPVVVRRGDYTFEQLRDWRDRVSNEVLPVTDAVMVDLDEGRNRVVIGLLPGASTAAVESSLDALAIPRQAVLFEVAGLAMPDVLLTDSVRPLVGGLQIVLAGGICTEWVNATRSGQTVFLTSSHCLHNMWANNTGVAVYQNSAASETRRVGRSIADPASFRCGPFWDRDDCRYSDAAVILHETSALAFGFLARTVNRVEGTGGSGSLEIDANSPRQLITGKRSSALQGEEVNKLGRSTGWTYGLVRSTCADWEFQNANDDGSVVDGKLICQQKADYGRDHGDSGSPVFTAVGGTTRYLIGIHSRHDPSNGQAIYSPMSGIERDLGPLTVTLWVSISGPPYVDVEGTYRWEAVHPSGTYGYQWSVYYYDSGVSQQLGTAKTQDLDVWAFGDFSMNVSITSGEGAAASNSLYVRNCVGGCGGPLESRVKPQFRRSSGQPGLLTGSPEGRPRDAVRVRRR